PALPFHSLFIRHPPPDSTLFPYTTLFRSPGIEPIAANVFLQKTLSGSFSVRNRHLQKLLAEKGMDNDAVWSSITTTKGSVQHLRSEEHTSELQSRGHLVCRLLLEKKKLTA